MSAKTFAALALCAAIAWHQRPHHAVAYSSPPPVAERSVAATANQEFEALFFDDRPLASLAEAGSYTAVEVYINTCSVCKRIEGQLPALLRQRQDVVVRRVHMPEHGLSFPQSAAAALGPRLDAYGICGTPHIEIYQSDGTLLVRDDCGRKHGLAFLEAWLAAIPDQG